MKKNLLLILLLLALPFTLGAQLGEKLPIDPNVKYGKLENGLTYYIRKNSYPEKRAEFYIAQKVGSMQEDDNQRGLAHFLEHMAFNGTKHYPGRKNMTDYLEKIGAKFGANVNAYTSFDETVYNLSDIPVVREGIIDSCLLILHDWSSFITLDDKEIDKERLIIKEEWRTRGNAQMRIWEQLFAYIYKDSKYANRMPIGTMEVVEHFPYQTLKDYYNKWYRADLQAIIIVGDIDPDAIEAKVKKMFADIPKPVNPAERAYYPVPDNKEPIVATVTDAEAIYTIVNLFFKHDPLPPHIKETETGLFLSYLKSMAAIMLNDRLNEIANKADSPLSYVSVKDGDFFVSKTKDAWSNLALSKEGKIKETLATLFRESLRVKKHGFTDAEVERAKANMMQSYDQAYNNRNKQKNSSFVREYVGNFSNGEAIPGIEFEYNMYKKIMPMLNTAIFNQVIPELIGDENIVISVTGPQKEDITYPSNEELLAIVNSVKSEKIDAYEEKVSNEPLITNLPKKGKIVKTEKNANLGAICWTLSNGMRVVLKKTDFKDDEIVMSSIAYGGTSIVPDADIFNAYFVSSVPEFGGIGNFSSTNLKKALAGKRANVHPNISTYTQGFSGSSSMKDIETLLQLTYLHFTAPRKDAEAFSSNMEAIKNQLKNLKGEPSYIMHDSTNVVLYGNNPRKKTFHLEDAEKMNYDRIIELYKSIYANPGSFVFTFTGTIDENVMKPLVEQYLASLPAGNKNAKYKTINEEAIKGVRNKVFEQSMKNPKASAFNYYSGTIDFNQKNNVILDALKQILDIVYVETIREEEGGTYGVRVQASCSRIPSGKTGITMTYDTNPDKAETLNKRIHKELKNIAENGPKEVDMKKVKEFMVKNYQENIKVNGFWNGILNNFYFYNQDWSSSYVSAVNALTADDIKNLTNEILKQNNFVEVIMLPKE